MVTPVLPKLEGLLRSRQESSEAHFPAKKHAYYHTGLAEIPADIGSQNVTTSCDQTGAGMSADPGWLHMM